MLLLFFNAIIVLLCACACTTQQRKIDWNSLVLCNDVRSILLFVVSSNSSSIEEQQLTDRNSRSISRNVASPGKLVPPARWPTLIVLLGTAPIGQSRGFVNIKMTRYPANAAPPRMIYFIEPPCRLWATVNVTMYVSRSFVYMFRFD